MSDLSCIFIEWQNDECGVQKASLAEDLETIKKQSDTAIIMAMGTMKAMAERVADTMSTLNDNARPDEAEVEFGITLDAEAGALIAKASAGAQLKVKLKWQSRSVSD